MYVEIAAAIQAVKGLNDLVKATRELKNFNDFVAAISEVNTKLMEAEATALNALERQLSLTNRVGELEQEIMDFKNWERAGQRYQLFEIASGVYAYKLKPGVQPPEPSHMLCANCYSKRQKSILQHLNQNEYGQWFICHNCKSEVSIHRDPGNATGSYNPLTHGFEPV